MANVQAWVTNNAGQKVGLTLDENSDLLEHLRKMQKREDIEKLEVKKVPASKSGN